MDGTYGSPFQASQPPMSPMSTLAANSYKANVSRKKTRKWVEAKVQNYDGDDWGNDYDDEPEDEPPLPVKPQGPRPPMSGQPSPLPQAAELSSGLSFLPSSNSPLASSGGARNATGPPALQIQTQQQQQQQHPTSMIPGRSPPTSETESPWRTRRAFTGGAPDNVSADLTRPPPQGQSPAAASPSGLTALPFGKQGLAETAHTSSPTAASASRTSSPPQSAGPVSSKFPPRKSSMSKQDTPPEVLTAMLRQPPPQGQQEAGLSPGSRPGSGQRPWVAEGRSASPHGPRSPASAGGNKPLPLIRPSDIYRRMEEEKEKERRSLDSGRPSMDSIGGGGRPGERVDSPSRAVEPEQVSPQQQTGAAPPRRTSFGREDGADSVRARPGLETVAERKSEYGLESYLKAAGLGDEDASDKMPGGEQETKPAPEPKTAPAGSAPPAPGGLAGRPSQQALPSQLAATNQPQEPGEEERDEEEPEPLRRFSTSPKLPDFTRMSSFGIDLFGGDSTTFIDSSEPPRVPAFSTAGGADSPPIEAIPTPSPLSQPSPTVGIKTGRAVSPVHAPSPGPQLGDSIAKAPPHQASSSPSESTEQLALKSLSDFSAASAHADAVPSEAGKPATIEAVSDKARGDWTASPPAVVSPSREAASSAQVPDPAPVGNEAQAQHPSTNDAVRLGAAIAATMPPPLSAPAAVAVPFQITKSGTGASTGEPAASEKSRQPADAENSRLADSSRGWAGHSTVVRDRSPHGLPPLQTQTQAHLQTTLDSNSKQKSSEMQPASTTTPITTTSEIPPTAPLNPRRSVAGPGTVTATSTAVEETFEPPESLARIPTMSTTATVSPVKESDKLREEIIKSLSPLRGPQEFLPPSAGGGSGPGGRDQGPINESESSVPRKSAYLGDIYDDYYGSTDDKLDDGASDKHDDDDKASPVTLKQAGSAASASASAATAAPTLNSDVAEIAPLSPRKAAKDQQPSSEVPSLRKRFSWEAVPPPTLDSAPANAAVVAAAPAIVPSSVNTDAPIATAAISAPTEPPLDRPEPKSLVSAPFVGLPSAQPPSSVSSAEGGGGGAAKISHQVSQGSTVPPGTRLAPLEPPSPVSVQSDDRNVDNVRIRSMLSLAEEKQIMESSASPISPPPTDQHPALAGSNRSSADTAPQQQQQQQPSAAADDDVQTPSPGTHDTAVVGTAASPTAAGQQQQPMSPTSVKILPFREIMAFPTAAERIEHMNATRQIFIHIDSGVEKWLGAMTAQPEYAGATWSLRDNIYNMTITQHQQQQQPDLAVGGDAAGSTPTGGAAAASGQQQPLSPAARQAQTPYYQQYLDASNSTLQQQQQNAPQSGLGRPQSGGIMYPNLGSGSGSGGGSGTDFRHSSKEVGVKGKELLMAAGKAGKGLFSKGKSKLRERTADKKNFS